MNYLEGWEKFIIGVVVVGLIVLGMMTVFSQINYGSPLIIFGGNILSKGKIKTEQKPTIQTRTATVKEDLNFRPAPNTNNTPYYILKSGAKVNVISVQNGWAKITDISNKEGYVDNSYLQY